jgi:ankyrin repeat protein
LHVTVCNSTRAILVLILPKAAVAFANAKECKTRLEFEIRGGCKAIAERLLANGADINAKDNIGGPPVGWAAVFGHHEFIDLLLQHNAKSRGAPSRKIS